MAGFELEGKQDWHKLVQILNTGIHVPAHVAKFEGSFSKPDFWPV
jgi:hypothetical protein